MEIGKLPAFLHPFYIDRLFVTSVVRVKYARRMALRDMLELEIIMLNCLIFFIRICIDFKQM